jgi:hypothetical protein
MTFSIAFDSVSVFIFHNELEPFAEKHGIRLEELEMRSSSLLNRSADSFKGLDSKFIGVDPLIFDETPPIRSQSL